jgi:multicomponent Na+:H+ antiporter subunit C
METLLAILVGLLFATGTYLVLRKNLLRFIFGLVILGNAANLLLFTAGRATRGKPPLIPEGAEMPVGAFANPLPQALVLTAIVIAFGLTAFTLVLVLRGYGVLGSVETAALKTDAVPAGTAAPDSPDLSPGKRPPDTSADPHPVS